MGRRTSKEIGQLCAFKLTTTTPEEQQGGCTKPDPLRGRSKGTAATDRPHRPFPLRNWGCPQYTKQSQ